MSTVVEASSYFRSNRCQAVMYMLQWCEISDFMKFRVKVRVTVGLGLGLRSVILGQLFNRK